MGRINGADGAETDGDGAEGEQRQQFYKDRRREQQTHSSNMDEQQDTDRTGTTRGRTRTNKTFKTEQETRNTRHGTSQAIFHGILMVNSMVNRRLWKMEDTHSTFF